jgi:hypothetical protein
LSKSNKFFLEVSSNIKSFLTQVTNVHKELRFSEMPPQLFLFKTDTDGDIAYKPDIMHSIMLCKMPQNLWGDIARNALSKCEDSEGFSIVIGISKSKFEEDPSEDALLMFLYSKKFSEGCCVLVDKEPDIVEDFTSIESLSVFESVVSTHH